MRDTGTGGVEADFLHRHVEATTVFRFINRVGGRADHGDAKFFQHTLAFQLKGAVECRLAAHGGQHRVRALFFDNFTYHFPVNRLDVSGIGHFRVSHNGRRVRVDQNDAVAFFAQRFTRLGARVVKFAGLPDNNRASAKDQDAFYICTFWHGSFLLIIWRSYGTAQLIR